MFLWEMISESKNINFSVKSYVEADKLLWNKNLEIMYCLSGTINFWVGDQKYILTEEDFFVFNPYELHNFEKGSYLVLSIFFDENLLQLSEQHRYFCFSEDLDVPENHFENIRRLCADMLLMSIRKEDCLSYQIHSNALQIMAILDQNFIRKEESALRNSAEIDSMMQAVIRYLDDTYQDPITVEEIGQAVGLTARALSYQFKKIFGVSIMQYLKRLRLTNAYRELMDTEHSIFRVALDNGFPNTNAFIKAFREFYAESPAKFRKESKGKSAYYNNNLTVDEDIQRLDSLTKHSTMKHDDFRLLITGNCEQYIRERVDVRKSGRKRSASWNQLCNVGWAKEALLAPVQMQIIKAKQELGFRHIHFHGVFDDDMQICRIMQDGKLDFNFTYIDMLFDFLLGQGFDLDIEFGFIPSDLAKNPEGIFQHRSHPCAPKRMQDWMELIRNFLLHCINRYGSERVLQWKFELFSAKYIYYQTISLEEYWQLYICTYQSVKGILPNAKYGYFGDLSLSVKGNENIFEYMMVMALKAGIKPDFIALECFHGEYDALKGDMVLSTTLSQKENPTPRSKNPDFLSDKVEQLLEYMKVLGLEEIPVYLNTWNSSDWQEDMGHDSIYKASFLLKNILDNEENLQAFGYWTLSDLLEETRHKEDLFHGGFGMLTYNGIPKASYFAFYFLRHMGTSLLKKGDGYYVTKGADGIYALLYHYSHEEFLYQSMDVVSGSELLHKSSFVDEQIVLYNLSNGLYEISTTLLNQENGSAYDTWIKMGAPSELMPNQHRYIENVSRPLTTIKKQEIFNHQYQIEENVFPNEIYLIRIKKISSSEKHEV